MRVVVLRGSAETVSMVSGTSTWPQRIISFCSNGVGSVKIQEVAMRISEGWLGVLTGTIMNCVVLPLRKTNIL